MKNSYFTTLQRTVAGAQISVAVILILFMSTASARYLDPCLDPARGYEVSLTEADSLSDYFYSVLQSYNQHLEEYHAIENGLAVSFPVYPDMPDEFYEQNAENMHWIELGWDLDGLHANMYRLQSHYNQHIIENHTGVDTLVDAVYDLGFPDVEMSQREYFERKIFQLVMMVTKLKGAIDAHIEYHIDPTTLDQEPAEPALPEPEPHEKPEYYSPPETSPEEITEPDTDISGIPEQPLLNRRIEPTYCGYWFCPAREWLIVLSPDGRYTSVHPDNPSAGQYSTIDNQLILHKEPDAVPYFYDFEISADTMVLTDSRWSTRYVFIDALLYLKDSSDGFGDTRDSVLVQALVERFGEVYHTYRRLKARYNDHLGANSSVVPYLATCDRESLKSVEVDSTTSAGRRLEELAEKVRALLGCAVILEERFDLHIDMLDENEPYPPVVLVEECKWMRFYTTVSPDFSFIEKLVVVDRNIDGISTYLCSIQEKYEEHLRVYH